MEVLIQFIVSEMVDAPDEVRVNWIRGTNGMSIYQVRVVRGDTGKIIGRRGRNVTAIRTIIDAASKKKQERAIIEILE